MSGDPAGLGRAALRHGGGDGSGNNNIVVQLGHDHNNIHELQQQQQQEAAHEDQDQEQGMSMNRAPSRYEAQKRRDWNTFGQYLRNHRPPLPLARCTGTHVLEFVRYLDQFGKTKVHLTTCPYFGLPQPPHPCPCPLRQAWGSLDALIGRLRAAFEENGGKPESNPFGARTVRLYLREVREMQAKARGIAYGKKKRKRGGGGGAAGPSDHTINAGSGATSANNVHAVGSMQLPGT